MPPGTYTLVLGVDRSPEIEVGALGSITFDRRWYAYVGSAFGSGGLGRVDRHREIARGDRDVAHWHVDYLLSHDATTLETVVTWADRDVECSVARSLSGQPVPSFGSSDCDCPTHLIGSDSRATLERSIAAAVER